MRIVGLGRFNKFISKILGKINKNRFEKYIFPPKFKVPKFEKYNSVDISLVTFVNSNNFTDLILCIISFIDSVGEPKVWTLYLDADLSESQIILIRKFHFIQKYNRGSSLYS